MSHTNSYTYNFNNFNYKISYMHIYSQFILKLQNYISNQNTDIINNIFLCLKFSFILSTKYYRMNIDLI
jgi:hypothetical protein